MAIILADTTGWLQSSAIVLGMAVGSTALLRARTRPILPALAFWAAVGLCVGAGVMPLAAGAALAIAVLGAVLSDRLPKGLVWALFAWLASLAAGWTWICVMQVPAGKMAEVLSHTAAALAAWWMFAASLAERRQGERVGPAGRVVGGTDRWATDARAAFAMTAATLAIASVILLAYSAVGVTYWRLTQGFWRVTSTFEMLPIYLPVTAWQGLVDIGLVILAVQLSRWVGRWPGLPVATLWLVIFAGTWWGLMLPPSPSLTASAWPGWLTWLVWIQTAWTWPLLAGILIWIWRGWQAQERAWPKHLESLVRVSAPWPGLEATATAIGLVLVPLGLWHAISAGAGSTQVVRLTTWEMAAAALGLSILIGWRWNRAAAELALSLWTLALAALGATTALEVATPRASIELLPVVHTGVLAGLACASLLWFWLAGFWAQQLDDGRAWTTAGRLIPLTDRVGFLAAALAVLVGAKLALWPQMQHGSADNSLVRVVVGSLTYVLLIAVCMYAAVRVRKGTMLWLAGMAALAWGRFLWVRW